MVKSTETHILFQGGNDFHFGLFWPVLSFTGVFLHTAFTVIIFEWCSYTFVFLYYDTYVPTSLKTYTGLCSLGLLMSILNLYTSSTLRSPTVNLFMEVLMLLAPETGFQSPSPPSWISRFNLLTTLSSIVHSTNISEASSGFLVALTVTVTAYFRSLSRFLGGH